jgi:hypothetical protein
MLACLLMPIFWKVDYTDLGPFRATRLQALNSLKMMDRNYGWTVEMQIRAAQVGLDVSNRRFDIGSALVDPR